jgi:glycosyltransferase involved in cell wall biosynthesis
VQNLPKGETHRGLGFHLEQLKYMRRVIQIASEHEADLFIMSESTGHYFLFPFLAPKQMGLIPSLHTLLWPKVKKPSLSQKVMHYFNGRIFTNRAIAILCHPLDIEKQLRIITGNSLRPLFPFLPTYRKDNFVNLSEPSSTSSFHVLFAGRMEVEKGIFDLLHIASHLKQSGHVNIHLHLCGGGSCEARLRQAAADNRIMDILHIHGFCQRDKLQKYLSLSHVMIVPTTTSFVEGFNQVVVESILAGRPVISSDVCPALAMVREAAIEVSPDNWKGYFDAIIQLANNNDYYQTKKRACRSFQAQFYDPNNSWGQAVLRVIHMWINGY